MTDELRGRRAAARAPILHRIVAFGAATVLIACQPCGRTGMTIFADARTTTITAPPGGGSQSRVTVTGSNFNSSVPMTISFRNYPGTAVSEFSEPATTDAGGAVNWSKDVFQLPQRNFSSDPQVDVFVTAKENNTGCFAMTSIKTGRILNPPL